MIGDGVGDGWRQPKIKVTDSPEIMMGFPLILPNCSRLVFERIDHGVG